MPGNNLGRRQPGNSAVPSTVGHLGVNGFWVGDYVRGGVRVGRPVGARWRSPVRGTARCPYKINNQHTLEEHAILRVTESVCSGRGSFYQYPPNHRNYGPATDITYPFEGFSGVSGP